MATQFSVRDGRRWKGSFYSMWVGQKLSLLGSNLVSFGFIWYLTETYQSATVLSMASLAGLLPRVLLTPFLGPLVDRFDRKKIMMIADGVIAALTLMLSVLFVTDNVALWQIYLVLLFRSIFEGFHGAASGASITLMVPREKLVNVSGLDQAFTGGMGIVGGPLGAILLGLVAVQGLMWIEVGTAVVAIMILVFVNVPNPDVEEVEGGFSMDAYREDLKIGFRYLFTWKGLFMLKIGSLTINLLLTPAFSLLALLTTEHFLRGAIELGVMESIFGMGVLVMGLVMSAWGGFARKMRSTSFGLFLLAVGMLLIGVSPEGGIWYGYAAAGVIGVALVFTDAPLNGLMKEIVHPEMQGRLSAITTSMGSLGTPIGLMLAGPFADRFGIENWFLLGGIVYLALLPLFLWNSSLNSLEKGHPMQANVKEMFGLKPKEEAVVE